MAGTSTTQNQAAIGQVVAALERNTAALLTVAAMIERRTSDIRGTESPDFI